MAELAQIVAHLAVLVDADRRLPTGVAWIAAHGRGAVAGELAVVAGWMRDGMSATVALRRWASTSGCDGAARLAAVASGPIHQLAYGLRDLARDLERRVHDDQMAVLHLVAHVVWAVTVVAVAVAVARA